MRKLSFVLATWPRSPCLPLQAPPELVSMLEMAAIATMSMTASCIAADLTAITTTATAMS